MNIDTLRNQLAEARILSDNLLKQAFQAAPMDPSMQGGPPPGPPIDPATGQPMMDPSMQGGPPIDPATGQPMMDPSMQGGPPPGPPIDPATGQPMMDPSMQGGPPPGPPAGEAGVPDELIAAIEELGSAVESISQQLQSLSGASEESTKVNKDLERRVMKLEVSLKGPAGING